MWGARKKKLTTNAGEKILEYIRNNSDSLFLWKVMTMIADVARGLEHLHSQGIVHYGEYVYEKLVGRSINRVSDRLAGWLVGWLVDWPFFSFSLFPNRRRERKKKKDDPVLLHFLFFLPLSAPSLLVAVLRCQERQCNREPKRCQDHRLGIGHQEAR